MKKTILYYSDCFIFGGCENVIVNLIDFQEVRSNFNVHFAYAMNKEYQEGVDEKFADLADKHPLCILSNNNLFYRIEKTGMNRFAAFLCKLPFHMLQKSGIYAICNFFRLFLFFKKIKPDLLHINNGGYPGARSCLVAVLSAKAAGVLRIVFTVNNQAKRQKNSLEKFADRYIHNHVDYFVTASDQARTTLIRNRGFKEEKVVQIFNAMKQEQVSRGRIELLAEYGVPTGAFVIVSVAILTERKGQMWLLEAMNKLRIRERDVFENLFLFLVGEGEDRLKIEKYVQECNLTGRVILTGHRRDYYDFIAASYLFVLPSVRDEDMPLVILSAMGLARGIVSTRVAGIIEEIRDGVDGILLDPAELNRLDDVILEMYRDREALSRLGSSALERYRACFTLEKILGQYTDIYNELVGR